MDVSKRGFIEFLERGIRKDYKASEASLIIYIVCGESKRQKRLRKREKMPRGTRDSDARKRSDAP